MAILVNKGLTESEAQQALATAATTAANKAALKSQNALSRGISSLKNGFIGLGKAMAAHPYITIAIAATTLISVMVALAKNAKTTEEKIADLNEKFNEISEKVKTVSSEFQNLKKSTDSIIPRFAELSKGVDRFGKNIDLTDEEYEEFVGLGNQLAGLFPELNAGMDSNGNYMLNLAYDAENLTDKLNALVEAERLAANQEVADTLPDAFQNVTDRVSLYEKEIEDIQRNAQDALDVIGYLYSDQNKAKYIDMYGYGWEDALNRDAMTNTAVLPLMELLGVSDDQDAWKAILDKYTEDSYVNWEKLINGEEVQHALSGVEQQVKNKLAQIENAFNSLDPVISSWMDTDLMFQSLSSDDEELNSRMQDIAKTMASNLDLSQYATDEEAKQFISSSIIKPIASMSDETQSAFADLLSLNPDGLSVQEYIDTVNDSISEIAENSSFSTDRLFDLTGLDDVVSKYKEDVEDIMSSLGSDVDQDELYKLNKSQLERVSSLVKTYGIKSWQAIKDIIANDPIPEISIDISVEKSGLESISTAINESVSAAGASVESIDALTERYRELDGFNPEGLFERTANGIHLNAQALDELEKAYEDQKKSSIDDYLKQLHNRYDELTLQINRTTDASARAALYADRNEIADRISDTETLAAQYDGLTSAYNKWVQAQSAPKESDAYAAVGAGYEEMKKMVDQGWYGNEALNEYLDLLLSAEQRTGDAAKDFEKLSEIIDGTGRSIMDYWSYDEDGNLVTDGLFDFLDDVKKVFGEDFVSYSKEFGYAFDFADGKLEKIADHFSISTELIELFERALIEAGMAVDLSDSSISDKIQDSVDALLNAQKRGLISESIDLEFDINTATLKDLSEYIEELDEAATNIDAEVNPDAYRELELLRAMCAEQYWIRLNTSTDGALDKAVSLTKELQQYFPLDLQLDVSGYQRIDELSNELAALPKEVQVAIGIKEANIGNAESILKQFMDEPETIEIPVSYNQTDEPTSEYEATVDVGLGDWPKKLPKPIEGVVNVRLGSVPTYLEGETVSYTKTKYRTSSAYADGTVNGRISRDHNALVNELGTESMVRDGKWSLIPGGTHVEKLKRGDIIFTADQTKELLRSGKLSNGAFAYSNGTAYNGMAAYSDVGYGGNRRPGSGSEIGYVAPSDSASSSSSSISDDAKDTVEALDWIEVAISRIERVIDRLKTTATSTYKTLSEKLGATYDEINMVNQELEIQEKAYSRYLKEANSVGISSDLAALVQNGAIDISEYDEETRELISQYQDFYEKALDCSDAILELKESLASLYEEKFDSIQSDFEGQLSILEHLTASYENDIDTLEARGYLESAKHYAALQDVAKQNITILNKELNSLEQSFSEAMNSGEIEAGSEAYYSMATAINDVKEEIDNANLSLIEYGNTMREIEWGYFDFVQDRISQLTQESNFLIDLMSDTDLHTEDGQLTDTGNATVGLHAMNYNTYMAQANQYAEELREIEEQLAEDPYNTDLIERREELLELQQDSISAAEDEKQAIIDLVKEGIEYQLESVKELIDTYTEALDSAKNLYEYQNKISDHNEKIASIEKQLSAYQGNTSEEAKATIQKLQVELKDAKADLQETEYDQYISDQKQLLDALYVEYETVLNQRLDNIDVLIDEMIGMVNANTDSINATLIEVVSDVGYTLTESMQSVWNGSTTALDGTLSVYGDGFNEKLTAINNVLNQIQANTMAMVSESDESAVEDISSTNSTPDMGTSKDSNTSSAPSTNNSPTTDSSSTKTITVGGKINAKGAKIYSYPGDTSGQSQYYSDDPYYTVLEENSGYLKVRWHKLSSGVTGWFKKKDVKAYKTGGLIDYTGPAWVDGTPGKPESILSAKDTENLIALTSLLEQMKQQGLSIRSAGNCVTSRVLHSNSIPDFSSVLANISNSQRRDTSASVGDINITIPIEHVNDYNDFVNQLRDDRKFEELVRSWTIDRIVGGSSLAKNKHKW